MLVKANRFPRGSVPSRFARLCAAVAVCAIIPTLAVQAEASAALPVVQTLGAVVHTAGSSVPSTVSTAAGQTTESLPSGSTPPAVAPTPTPSTATPTASAQQSPASTPPKAPPVAPLSGTVTRLAAVTHGASERIATHDTSERVAEVAAGTVSHVEGPEGPGTASVLPVSAVKGTVATIVQTSVRGGGPPVRAAAAIVQGAANLHRDAQTVLAATRDLAQTSGASQIVQAVAQGAPTAAGRVANIAGAIHSLARLTAGPEIRVVRSFADIALAPSTPAAARVRARVEPASLPDLLVGAATAATAASDRSGAALAKPRTASSWAKPWTNPSSAKPRTTSSSRLPGRPSSVSATRPPGTQLLLPGGQSAASSPAHGARPASLPASPAPTPSSPGGVSPATAVGSAGGISLALALIALLMLATPPVQRRLRPLVESWPRAPFVLIADRPG